MTMHGINSRFRLAHIDDGGSGNPNRVQKPTQEEDTSIFSGVAGFDAWSNSETPQDEFTMFDLDLSTYSKDLNEFAQSYIDSYDADGDSNMSFEEFVQMASHLLYIKTKMLLSGGEEEVSELELLIAS